MAPTICSDKTKQQNLRVSHKELRRHRQISRNLSLAHATPQASGIISYASNGSLNVYRRSDQNYRHHDQDEGNNNSSNSRMKGLLRTEYNQNSQTSDDFVSSSSNEAADDHQSYQRRGRPNHIRSTTPISDVCSIQYSDDFMLEDDEDDQRLFPYDTDNKMADNDDKNSISSSILSNDKHSIDDDHYEDDNDNNAEYISNTLCFKQSVLNMPNGKPNPYPKKNCSTDSSKDCDKYRNGLLSIALKTIKLVQRNKLLQERLAQLQTETSEFIQSVLANPENKHFRDKIHQTQGQHS